MAVESCLVKFSAGVGAQYITPVIQREAVASIKGVARAFVSLSSEILARLEYRAGVDVYSAIFAFAGLERILICSVLTIKLAVSFGNFRIALGCVYARDSGGARGIAE